MAITQTIATLPAVLNDSSTFYEDIAERNNSLVTTVLPSINTWATQANATQEEINAKAAQVAAQAVDGGYSQNYINTNFVGVNNAQDITEVKTFTVSPLVPTTTTSDSSTKVASTELVDNKITDSATTTNTANKVVKRDASGNFSAGTITATLKGNASSATNATKLNGQNFYWSGQGGQPDWIYGGSDGINLFVYNPLNFNVNYANSAGNANYISPTVAGNANAGLDIGNVGSYAFLTLGISGGQIVAGSLYSGSSLYYSGVAEDAYNHGQAYDYLWKGNATIGTWRAMGDSQNSGNYEATLFLRIA